MRKEKTFFYLSLDHIKDALIGDQERDNNSYQNFKHKTYDIAKLIIKNNIEDIDIVLEGTFWDKISIGWAEKELRDTIGKSHIIEELRCITSELEIYSRLLKRGFKRDKNKLKDKSSWNEFMIREPINFEWFKGTKIDTTIKRISIK